MHGATSPLDQSLPFRLPGTDNEALGGAICQNEAHKSLSTTNSFANLFIEETLLYCGRLIHGALAPTRELKHEKSIDSTDRVRGHGERLCDDERGLGKDKRRLVAGKSDISKIQGSDPQAFERLQTYNPDNDHLVTHDLDKIDKIVVNFNSNNPNGPHPQ